MKNILILIVLALVVWGGVSLFKRDSYVGFYYPDSNDLSNDIQSPETFKTLDACRDWADEQMSVYNPDGIGYDYECGKNCNLSTARPYVCEETFQ